MRFSIAVKKRIFALIVLSFYLLSPVASWACTAIVVGKDASTTGRTLIARTEDSRPEANKKFIVVPAGFYKAGTEYILDVSNNFRITPTRDSYKYTAMPDTTRNAITAGAAGEGAMGTEETSKDNPVQRPHWEDGFHFTFDSNGVNEKGFMMSATETTSMRTGIPSANLGSNAPGDIGTWTYRTMTKTILPFAANCDEAFELINGLLAPGLNNQVDQPGARHQRANAEIMFIADQNEAWIIDIVGRYHYVAIRVPHDSFTPISNSLHTQFFDENDTANYRSNFKPNTYAEENGFARYQLDENGVKRVNISLTYGATNSVNGNSNTYRRWRGLTMFAPSQGNNIQVLTRNNLDDELGETYPNFIKPDKKISPMDIAMFQRDRYAGTPFDSTYGPQYFTTGTGINAGFETESATNRPIGTATQQHSHIYDVGGNLPPEIGARFWNSRAQAETGVNIPFYGNIMDTHPRAKFNTTAIDGVRSGQQIPPAERKPVYNPESAHSIFTHTGYLARADRWNYVAPIQAFWRDYELKLYNDLEKVIEPELLRLYAENPEASAKFITDYTIAVSDRAFRTAEIIHDALVAHISNAPNTLFKIPVELIEPTSTYLVTPTDEDKKAVLNAGIAAGLLSLGKVQLSSISTNNAPKLEGHNFNLPGSAVEIELNQEQVAARQTAAKLVFDVEINDINIDKLKEKLTLVIEVGGKVIKLVGQDSDALISLNNALDKGIATITLTSDGAIVALEYILADGPGTSGIYNDKLVICDGNANAVLSGIIWAASNTTTTPDKPINGCALGFDLWSAIAIGALYVCLKRSRQ